MAELPLAQGINRFKQNEERMDQFTNGTDTQTITHSGGEKSPTLRKFLKDKSAEINTNANVYFEENIQRIEDSTQAAEQSAENAENSAVRAEDSVFPYLGIHSTPPTERPGTPPAPLQAGDVYFSSLTNTLVIYDGNDWFEATETKFTPQVFDYIGDGVTKLFPLPEAVVGASHVITWVGGSRQNPLQDYTTPSGTAIEFISAPAAGLAITGLVLGSATKVVDALSKATYDPQNRNTDVFAYVDELASRSYQSLGDVRLAVIPFSITEFTTLGGESPSDGDGGTWSSTDTGSGRTVQSANGRTFWQLKDIAENRLKLNYLRQIKNSYEVSVGTGGDFTTINAALMHLSQSYPTYLFNGFDATIKLKAGFVMNESVILRNGINMGWVKIVGEDAQTIINRSALTTEIYPANFAAFGAANNCVLPIIGQLFEMDVSGTGSNRHGIMVFSNSSAVILGDAGVNNAGGDGLFAVQLANVQANGAKFMNAGRNGVNASRSASVNASLVDAKNAGENGIYANNCSDIQAVNAIVDGAKANGLYAFRTSDIFASDASIKNCGTSNEDAGAKSHHGSTISCYRSNFDGCRNGVYSRHAGIIDADTSTITNCVRYGVLANYGGMIDVDNAVVTGAGYVGIGADYGGKVAADSANVDGSLGEGVWSARASEITMAGGSVRNAASAALRAVQSGRIYTSDIDATGAGTYGAHATSCGEIRASNIKLTTGKEVSPLFNTASSNGAVVWGNRAT